MNGEVVLKNITKNDIVIRRGRVFGEIRTCREAAISEIKDRRKDKEIKQIWDINNVRKIVAENDRTLNDI